MLPSLVLRDAAEQLRRLEPYVLFLVEEAEREVKQPGVRLGRDGQKEADFVVGVDVFGKGEKNVAALRRIQPLHAKSIMHVRQIDAFERSHGVYLRKVLVFCFVSFALSLKLLRRALFLPE